jgi:hypothetical protein
VVANKNISRKEKRTLLDVTRHAKGSGEQATNKNERKLGRSKKTKWRNIKKNWERQEDLPKKMPGAGRAQ